MNLSGLREMLEDLSFRPKLAREGIKRTIFYLGAGSFGFTAAKWLEHRNNNLFAKARTDLLKFGSQALLGLGTYCAFFYRDPNREPLGNDPDFIYAPADGTIASIEERVEEPKFIKGSAYRITIACSLLDVHLQRSPVAGQIRYLFYDENPSRYTTAVKVDGPAIYAGISTSDTCKERRILISQQINYANPFHLPGVLSDKKPGSLRVWVGINVKQGQKIGFCPFGQPLLITLYISTENRLDLLCQKGQHVQAGMSILGRFK